MKQNKLIYGYMKQLRIIKKIKWYKNNWIPIEISNEYCKQLEQMQELIQYCKQQIHDSIGISIKQVGEVTAHHSRIRW